MNSRPRRKHSLAFKAQTTLAALVDEHTLAGSVRQRVQHDDRSFRRAPASATAP